MTTTTTATRADRIPEGLCMIYEHGSIPGGLAYKYGDEAIIQVADLGMGLLWSISDDELADHWGDAMVAIPRTLAEASTDPAVVAWVKSNINQKEK